MIGRDGSMVGNVPLEMMEHAPSPFELRFQTGNVTPLQGMGQGEFSPYGHDTEFGAMIGDHSGRGPADELCLGATDEDGDNVVTSPLGNLEESAHLETATDTFPDDLGRSIDEADTTVPSTVKRRKKESARCTGKRTPSVDKVQARYFLYFSLNFFMATYVPLPVTLIAGWARL